MGRMSDKDIDEQEKLTEEELFAQDIDNQVNPENTIDLLRKSGLKLVFNDKDLEKMVKIQEKDKK